MFIKYENWNPRGDSMALVVAANDIIEEYQAAGYILTLRQLYYQFVSRAIIENTERSYKNLGSIITKARMSGFISWEAIEDRTRTHNDFWTDENELNPIKDLPRYIRYDRWARQNTYIEVWVEKEALGNVIAKACKPLLVPHMACKGYLSASEAWRAGQRFNDKLAQGKECVLIHLGDHDPSGIDMTRDNNNRLNMFTNYGVNVGRIALNMDQVESYRPPPNPAKVTDSRAKDYIARYGAKSWELDALEPSVLEALITDEITQYIDGEKWQLVDEQERETRDRLRAVYDNWSDIRKLLDGVE